MHQSGRVALIGHFAASLACARSHFNHMICGRDHGKIVFYNYQRNALVHKPPERHDQAFNIGHVKARRGFVEHIDPPLRPSSAASFNLCRSPPDKVDSRCPILR